MTRCWPNSASDPVATEREIRDALAERLGAVHARRRLGIEIEDERRVFGGGLNFFHPENWYALPRILRGGLKLCGLYGRARRNAMRIEVRRNAVALRGLPTAFDGYTILHLSDLHVDINDTIVGCIAARVHDLEYDLCVLSGDYRAATYGPIEPALRGMERLCAVLRRPVCGVLGNHDSVRMVPALEAMGIRMLMNESFDIERGGASVHLAGVDDPHYYRVDNLDRAGRDLSGGQISILLSHTPEIYRHAAHAGFDLMLTGHTHGGQICLPGGIPITLDARLPRRFGRGAWRYNDMQGYTSAGAGTSIVDVRLNCPPEVTLHTLRCE